MGRRPVILHYQLTERCNLACPGCYLPDRQGRGHAVGEVADRVFGPLAASGVRFVTLTGGEPLLHPQHLEICSLASRHFVERLLVCNGTFLTLEKYRELCDRGITSIKVSIDSLRPELHDRLRGGKGCFNRIVGNLTAIMNSVTADSQSVDIGIITTVGADNVDELGAIASWAEGMGINHVLFQPHHPYGQVYQNGGHPAPDLRAVAGKRLRDAEFSRRLAEQVEILAQIKRRRAGLIDNSFEMLTTLPKYFDGPDGVSQVCRADRCVFVDSDFGVRGCLFCGELGSLARRSPEDIYDSEAWNDFQRFRQGCRLCLMGCQFRGSAETLADDGFESYLAEDLDGAEACFNESLDVEPNVQAEHGLGLVHKARGDSAGAMCRLNNVLRAEPMHRAALVDLVALRFDQGDMDEVLRLCAGATRRGWRVPGLLYYHGLALVSSGDHEAAAEQFRMAAAGEPCNHLFFMDYGLALKKLKKYDLAMAAFARAVSLAPEEAFPHYALGVELARIGRDEDALRELERSLVLDPEFAWSHFQIGLRHHRHNEMDKARLCFGRALELEPDNEEFRKWAGLAGPF